ncbi:hypothetical protein GO003_015810 [Methylicorpusculum oleiharenae]|uniref:hypothetical protein n=1 Tax=Methylicorpusculum oleiharenae TaxID=1338687 RepID=UPI001357348C|nr:hypothetical protein [Methylicorpusculum oleiharenae]MCD2451853.1 hypothetical protein [Methylicorpusculum oleiharenae]
MNALSALISVYRPQTDSQIQQLTVFVEKLRNWAQEFSECDFLHPCLIDEHRALICNKDLNNTHPEAFDALSEITKHYGIRLKEDSRAQRAEQYGSERRQKSAMVLSLCIGLLIATSQSKADFLSQQRMTVSISSNPVTPANRIDALILQKDQKNNLRLTRSAPSVKDFSPSYRQVRTKMKVDKAAFRQIRRLLHQAYQQKPGDPAGIRADLDHMARYYAQFSDTIELLKNLENKPLSLQYRKNTWETEAYGNRFKVDSTTVFFDSRTGAKFGFHNQCSGNPACYIAPADALLHELLHVNIMLNDTGRFMAQGGMRPTLYLFEHEREVIKLEVMLFDAMNRRDGKSRPLRQRHTAKLVEVDCSLCLPGALTVASVD